MALIKCRECGNQVSSKAQSCPQCGARIARKPMGCGALIGLVLLGAFIVAIVSTVNREDNTKPAPPQTPEQIAAKKKKDEAVARAQIGARLLKQAMRDPDSFKLSQALVMDSGAVCYEYRARNGFGGMNVGHAVLSEDAKTFRTNEMSGFTALWNKACANKTGEDFAGGLNWML